MNRRNQSSYDKSDNLMQWDAIAGTRLVMSVRNAGGKIPPRLEPPKVLLDILASRSEQTVDADALDCVIPVMADLTWTQYQRAHSALSDLADAVGSAFSAADAVDDLTKNSKWLTRAEALDEAVGQLRRARVRINDPLLLDLIDQHVEPSPEGLLDPLEVLDRLLKALESARGNLSVRAPLPRGNATRQSVQIKGLAMVYGKEFGHSAKSGTRLNWEAYEGPFVSFVRVAFEIAGHPSQSDDALTQAIKRYMPRSSPRG